MDVYVIYTRTNAASPPIGAYTSWEKAQDEADNHAASVYQITKVLVIERIEDDVEIRSYGAGDQHLINYVIMKLVLDDEPKRPEPL